MNEKTRLSKVMADRGLCSRREADELIQRGWVKVDGQIQSELGVRVDPEAKIELHPQAGRKLTEQVTILLNKPIGYVSGQPEKNYPPAVRLITTSAQYRSSPDEPRLKMSFLDGLAPAGRLDIDSQGLLVFTQNGTIARQLIGADSGIEKEYLVRVRGKLADRDLERLRFGLALDDRPLKRAQVEWINQDQLRFVLTEGRKRQIRRMCEAVGLEVLGLKRVRIGKIRLGKLPEGQWRLLHPGERF